MKQPGKKTVLLTLFLLFIYILPKNLWSKLVGVFADIHWPKFVLMPLAKAYVALFQLNMGEAELPLENYQSLNQLFTRALKSEARPVDQGPKAVVSPVDGTILAQGTIEQGTLLQVKGKAFSLRQLLNFSPLSDSFEGGSFITIYLSPSDYHRIHAPLAGQVEAASYVPGALFPVNSIGVYHVSDLFARNERLVSYLQTKAGRVAVVKVGATSVGRIRVVYDQLVTNSKLTGPLEVRYAEPLALKKGQELGRFELGSTVILLFEKNKVVFNRQEGEKVQMGTAIARLKS